MNSTAKKVLIVVGILAGMVMVVLVTLFITYLIISGNTEEFSRA